MSEMLEKMEFMPRLRFPRYSTRWQRTVLKELLAEPPSYGLNAPAIEYRANLPLYLRITDIDENGRYLRDGRVSVAQAVTSDAYLERGDIAVARTGASVGKSYFCDGRDGPFVYAGFLIRLRANQNKLLPSLLAQWLRSDDYWRWVTLTSARSGQPGINGTEYASAVIPLPTGPLALEEQRTIAECLESVDELIASQIDKLETLKRHKKGLLQQLFPAEGETTPRLRFPQFREAEEWRVLSLHEVATVSGGKRVPKGDRFSSESTPFRYIRVSDLYMGGVDATNVPYISPETERSIRQYKVAVGDLFISVAGTIGLVGIIPPELDGANLTENADRIQPRSINRWFLLYFLMQPLVQARFRASVTSNAQPKLALDRIRSTSIALPSDEEQHQIGELFNELDRLNQSCLVQLQTLRTYKTALMQQLFPTLDELDAPTA